MKPPFFDPDLGRRDAAIHYVLKCLDVLDKSGMGKDGSVEFNIVWIFHWCSVGWGHKLRFNMEIDMSDENTPEIVVSQETLGRLRNLEMARVKIADQFLSLEQDKIQLLAAAKRLEDERSQVFVGIMSEYKLTEGSLFEIDRNTGKLTISQAQQQ